MLAPWAMQVIIHASTGWFMFHVDYNPIQSLFVDTIMCWIITSLLLHSK